MLFADEWFKDSAGRGTPRKMLDDPFFGGDRISPEEKVRRTEAYRAASRQAQDQADARRKAFFDGVHEDPVTSDEPTTKITHAVFEVLPCPIPPSFGRHGVICVGCQRDGTRTGARVETV